MKILVSAYACNPLATPESHPGEAWDGWNQVKQMLRFHDLTVITWQYNERVLEDKVKKDKIKNLKFYYLELPKIFQLFKKNYFGMRIYFWLWQVSAFSLAVRLHRKFKFDVFHHVTFHNDWMPSYIGAYLGIPFMWGPLGGGQKVPGNFGRELSLKDRLNEIARVILQEFWRHTPTRIKGMKKAKAVLVCNEETKRKVKKFTKNIFDFPVNGISMEELIPIRELTHQHTNAPTDQQTFKVLYAGRFDPIKAVPLAVRTFAEFNKKHPDSIFEIIGDGPEKGRIETLVMVKLRFYKHLYLFMGVNAFLILLNLITNPFNWWFPFPLIGWGIALFIHWMKIRE